jgi:hypothetical protein
MSQRGSPGIEFSSAVRRRGGLAPFPEAPPCPELWQPAVAAGIAAAAAAKPMKARRE